MSRKQAIWLGVVFVVINGLMITRAWFRPSRYAKENQQISSRIKFAAGFVKAAPIDMIGNLIRLPFWTEALPLAKDQQDAISKLDVLVREALYDSMLADARPYDGPPTHRAEDYARREERRQRAIRHAQRLVMSGLLTEDQAAFVTYKHLESTQLDALYDENDAELFDITPSQKEELEKALAEYRKEYYRLPAVANKSLDPEDQEEYYTVKKRLARRHNERIKQILTRDQLEKWDRLTSKRSLSADPPDLSRAALPGGAAVEVRDLSPLFRALADKGGAIGLSSEQSRWIRELEEITQDGLLWIGLDVSKNPTLAAPHGERRSDHVDRARLEFLGHAEQFVLLGILDEPQAGKLRAYAR
jgi:hypothetical protein